MMNVCHTTLSDNKSLVEEINDLRKKRMLSFWRTTISEVNCRTWPIM